MFSTFNSLVRAIQEGQVEPANNSDTEVLVFSDSVVHTTHHHQPSHTHTLGRAQHEHW